MHRIMDDICKELEDIEKKGLTGANWEMVAKLLEMKKNLLKIEDMEGGYSGDDYVAPSYSGRRYARDNTDYSGRHRDSMGRYATAADQMEDSIARMMDAGNLSAADKDTLRRALDVIRR